MDEAPPPPQVDAAPVAAVIFDMDGVVFEGKNFWLDLHRRYGGDVAEARALVDRYLATDYGTLAEVVVGKLWRGKPAEPYLDLVSERRYQPGVRETFSALRARGIGTAIVSSGPDLLARRAQRDLGVDAVRANGIEIADGCITGDARIAVPDGEKGEVGVAVTRELGVDLAEVASVGDSESDVDLAERVGMPISYDSSSERLLEVARHRLRHGELPRLLEVVGAVSAQPRVELLWWSGCPSWKQAIELVREEMAAVGLDPARLEVREVGSEQDAGRERFVGSPTIRVNGRDVQDPGAEPAGLTCRVYRLRDGTISALPDRADVRDALRPTPPPR